MKKPNLKEARKCLEIRKRSKRGSNSSREEHTLCVKMLEDYPEWYAKTEAIVFNETVPFGSHIHMKVDPEVEEFRS